MAGHHPAFIKTTDMLRMSIFGQVRPTPRSAYVICERPDCDGDFSFLHDLVNPQQLVLRVLPLPRHLKLVPVTMSRNAQVEEVYDDSDPEEVAPSDHSPADLARESILPSAGIPQPGASSMPMRPAPEPQSEIPKHFQCLYPVYFDKTRSRAEGRKVEAGLAVENPLARDIVDAVQMLGLRAGLEPEKQHPKDWANPGRVRVLLKSPDGKLTNSKVKNSMCSASLLIPQA